MTDTNPPPVDLDLAFGDGTYHFHLGLPQLAELQEKCGAGIGAIFSRVLKGRYLAKDGGTVGNPLESEWFAEDLFETIRLGLIGGGQGEVNGQAVEVSSITARKLIDRYVVGQPLEAAWELAAAILSARVVGYVVPKDEERPKAEAPADGSTTPAP